MLFYGERRGAVGAHLSDIAWYGTDAGSGERAGDTLSGGADLNADGFDDFVVGAPGISPGYAYLVHGGVEASGGRLQNVGIRIVTGDDFTGSFPQYIYGESDVNDDGQVDLILAGSAQHDEVNSPEIFVFYGPLTSGAYWTQDADVTLSESKDSKDYSLILGGFDVTGDFISDLIIASPEHGSSGEVLFLEGIGL